VATSINALKSPDGKLIAYFQCNEDGNLCYRFEINKKEVINSSKLSFNITPAENIPSKEWSINKISVRSNNSVWKPVWGKRAVVNDC